MDLLAYAQIEEYENLLKNNQIEIPRLGTGPKEVQFLYCQICILMMRIVN